MLSNQFKEIIKKLWITITEYYNLFWGISFIKKEKLIPWFKEDAPDWIVVKMSNGKKEPNNIVIVYIFCKNWFELFTDWFFLPSHLQRKWIRRKTFKTQIDISKKLWIRILTSKCTRSDDNIEVWYIAGPRLWYDGLHNSKKLYLEIKKYCKKKKISKQINKKILSSKSVLDLCSSQEWLACRKEIWRTFDAEFDLTKWSKSLKTFYKQQTN